MKPRLIIVSPRQYGYQTDYLKYAEYLPEHFNVVFLCLDQKQKRFENKDILLKYVRVKNKRLTYILFFVYAYLYVLTHRGAVMTTNFRGCRYLKKLMPWRKMVVNIRTVSVSSNPNEARLQNDRIRRDAEAFDRIIMISNGGARQLGLPAVKTRIVSLGADIISRTVKSFENLNLLYIGTFNGRNIIQTVQGVKLFLDKYPVDCKLTYDIIGDGEDFQAIREYVDENQLNHIVTLHGFMPYTSLSPFLDKCNIGVSYVPVTEWYMYQPPTKTFEYINSGLFCIATDTAANHEVISSQNGVLIQDNPDAFCEALHTILLRRDFFSSTEIRESGSPYTWKNIVNNQLFPVIRF